MGLVLRLEAKVSAEMLYVSSRGILMQDVRNKVVVQCNSMNHSVMLTTRSQGLRCQVDSSHVRTGKATVQCHVCDVRVQRHMAWTGMVWYS